jgi:hypothetical protein
MVIAAMQGPGSTIGASEPCVPVAVESGVLTQGSVEAARATLPAARPASSSAGITYRWLILSSRVRSGRIVSTTQVVGCTPDVYALATRDVGLVT